MWGPICRLNLINCIQTIWVDIQLYNDQNPKIAVYRNKYNIHQTQKVCKRKQNKKTNKTLEQFTKWPSGLQIYLHNCWKAFRSYFCGESNVTWRGEIGVLIVIKQIGQTDLMVAKLSWKKFHLSNGIYIHLTHERKILSIK